MEFAGFGKFEINLAGKWLFGDGGVHIKSHVVFPFVVIDLFAPPLAGQSQRKNDSKHEMSLLKPPFSLGRLLLIGLPVVKTEST